MTHETKVTPKDVESHRRSGLRDWDGCQDREDRDDEGDTNSSTDENLETDRFGKTTVHAQCRQQACANNSYHPANVYGDRVFACLPNCDARHDCDEADAV